MTTKSSNYHQWQWWLTLTESQSLDALVQITLTPQKLVKETLFPTRAGNLNLSLPSSLIITYFTYLRDVLCPSLLKQALLNTSRGQIDDINHLQVVHSVLNKNMVWFVILSEGWPTCSGHNQSEPFKHSTTVHDYQLHLAMAN